MCCPTVFLLLSVSFASLSNFIQLSTTAAPTANVASIASHLLGHLLKDFYSSASLRSLAAFNTLDLASALACEVSSTSAPLTANSANAIHLGPDLMSLLGTISAADSHREPPLFYTWNAAHTYVLGQGHSPTPPRAVTCIVNAVITGCLTARTADPGKAFYTVLATNHITIQPRYVPLLRTPATPGVFGLDNPDTARCAAGLPLKISGESSGNCWAPELCRIMARSLVASAVITQPPAQYTNLTY
ncbi:LOW QUALITY PROTEIN: hypothetical protein LZ30DRAFT_685637 [Colletotrichum cereale]|nr:LOW QUALITY PROTEIN: hypothetical protein LZ30DRAFT_685637 [Colletotrichum cereale]